MEGDRGGEGTFEGSYRSNELFVLSILCPLRIYFVRGGGGKFEGSHGSNEFFLKKYVSCNICMALLNHNKKTKDYSERIHMIPIIMKNIHTKK